MLSYAAPSLCTTPLTLLVAVHVMSFYEKIGANLSMLGIFVVCPRPCPAHAPTFVLTACRSRPPSASVQLTTARGVQVVAFAARLWILVAPMRCNAALGHRVPLGTIGCATGWQQQ